MKAHFLIVLSLSRAVVGRLLVVALIVLVVLLPFGAIMQILGKPELGLSNWQWGRLFGRGGVLSGDTVFTVRTRVVGTGT